MQKKLHFYSMLSKKKLSHQLDMFNTLGDLLNQSHPLYKLANKINWSLFDTEFSKHYCKDNGAPAKPIRLMVSLLILKHLRNLSDESVVEHWIENIYYQYFSGEFKISVSPPCVSSELVAFRHRIGESGMELILKESIRINDDETPLDKAHLVVSIDTTVQEKNITFPTDDKFYKKIIKSCWKMASTYGVCLRQSYTRSIKQLSYHQRFRNNAKGRKLARKADKRIKTIAGILVRELARKLPLDGLGACLSQLKFYDSILKQKRNDTDKIYSMHEPLVRCYTKGKQHKKYEFGSKVSIALDQATGIIVGAYNFTQTKHDSKTIPDVLEQCERLLDAEPKEAFVDRGYRGVFKNKNCLIQVPKPEANITKSKRKKHSNRAAIEPIIGHLKAHFRLCRNFYKGAFGDNINVILAAAAMNFKRVMNLWRSGAKSIRKWLIFEIIRIFYPIINLCPKMAF
jgi:IS5 family transposase